MADHVARRTTTARPDTVWRIWSDPSTWPDWNPSVSEASLDGPMRVGATGSMTTSRGAQRMSVVAVEPGRSFTLEMPGVPTTTFLFECRVEGGDGGATTISQGVRMTGFLGPVLLPLLGGRIVGEFRKVLDGLAQEAESQEAAPPA
jgi:uncharacterized protein YndB with AHSA1/START domain